MQTIKFQGQDYEVFSSLAVTASKIVVDTWERLGQPEDPFSASGAKMMDVIIAIWEDLYPQDRRDWYAARTLYKDSEKTISEQVRQKTGRSLASYPFPIYGMMKSVFRKFDPVQRDNCMKMVKKWPIFRFANKA